MKEKLRAQQADSFAAHFRDLLGILEPADVGEDGDPFAVARHRLLLRVSHVVFAARFQPRLPLADAFDLRGRRIQPQRTFAAIENDWCAVGDFRARVVRCQRSRESPASARGWRRAMSPPPRTVAKPTTRPRSIVAVSEGGDPRR
jgi:hypothetical protein